MNSPADPVTVVIPNFNGGDLLARALEAIGKQTRAPAAVIVVDNGSRDASVEAVSRYPAVQLVRLPRNLGFGAAANAGLARCATPNIAILNSDARPAATWLEELGARGPSDATVWAWGSVLISAKTGRVESAGDYVRRSGMSGKFAHGRRLDELPNRPYEVLAPPGAAPLMRSDVVRQLGGWFEPYFLYYEDLDLAMRARLAGYRCHVVPSAHVEHDLAGSSGGRAPWKFIARSSTWCAVRTNPQLSLASLAKLHTQEARVARRYRSTWPWFLGKAMAVPALPARLAERRRIMQGALERDWTPGPPREAI